MHRPKSRIRSQFLRVIAAVTLAPAAAPLFGQGGIDTGIAQEYQAIKNQAIIVLNPRAIDRSGLKPEQRDHRRGKRAIIPVQSSRIRSRRLSDGLLQLGAASMEITTRSHDELQITHRRTKRKADFSFIRDCALVTFENDVTYDDVVEQLRALPEVVAVHRNMRAYPAITPNDPNYSSQWGLPKIGMPTVWNSYKGENSTSIVVGAWDGSGINHTHTDLDGNIHSTSSTGTYTWFGTNKHGTQTAGVVSAETNNNNKIAGVSWNTKISLLHSGGASSNWDIMFALADLAGYADVIYHSWAIGSTNHLDGTLSGIDDLGVFQCAAAMNNGLNVTGLYFSPAKHPKVLMVGSSNSNDLRSSHSNYTVPALDSLVFAPGYSILTTDCVSTNCNSVGYYTGTSLAAPAVAGAAALMLVKNPGLSPQTIRDILHDTGKQISVWGGTVGMRIDAAAALQAVPAAKPVALSTKPVPENPELLYNYPNPFNAETTISFDLLDRTRASIEIYDVLGQHVRSFDMGELPSGSHSIRWDGRSSSGEPVATGLFLYRLVTGDQRITRRLLLIR